MSNKRLCVLQVTPEAPNEEHVGVFADKEDCDFFFVTHDTKRANAKSSQTPVSETRNTWPSWFLKYDYYVFLIMITSLDHKENLTH